MCEKFAFSSVNIALEQWCNIPRPRTGIGARINWYLAELEIFNYIRFIYYLSFKLLFFLQVTSRSLERWNLANN